MNSYPIAEIFTSPQGEGYWTGVLCTFVRLAGCNVGKPYTSTSREALGLKIYQEKCTAWNGQEFPCDTNYRKTASMTIDEIIAAVGKVPRMLLTGGEPLMHDIDPLLEAAWRSNKYVHIETSGTKPLPLGTRCSTVWVAVSPKQECLPEVLEEASEIRVLIGPDFDEDKFMAEFGRYMHKLFISPINDEHAFNERNKNTCLELQLKYNEIRLSTQTHKALGVR